MPIWTVLLGALWARERLSRRALLSAVAGGLAVALLAQQEFAHLAGQPTGVLWMQAAAVSWAVGTLMMRHTHTTLPNESVTVWMMAMGAVVFWCLAPWLEPPPNPAHFSTGMWWALAYGVFMNFGVAQIIWFGMARTLPPAASAFSIMAVPLVGTLSATWIVGETPHAADWGAAVFILAAIAAALVPGRGKSKPADSAVDERPAAPDRPGDNPPRP
jgi:drug/metabolite transporter (DMT)-like permease